MNLKTFAGSIGMFLLLASQTSGQIDYNKVPEVTNKIFINDVHVQKTPSVNIGLSDILIENGLIVKIGANMTPPVDAKVIEADSAYAYSGFIDAFSHIGIPKKESRGERPEVRFKGFPPNKVAGITPEKLASSEISHTEGSIKSHREAGFAIAHVVPRGRMLPGQGSIISLHGSSTEDMILKDQTSTFFQFSGARGYYPNTIIGVMAKWRDLYRKAHFHNKNLKNYKLNPSGTPRPLEDKTLNAIIPVTTGAQPVFMTTKKTKDIFRAVELQKELGYNLVLGDVKQIGAAQKHLKSSKIDILLSLDLPKEEDKKKADKDSTNIDDLKKSMLERKAKSYKEYISQAANLEKANIPFAFTLMSAKPKDLKSSIAKLIENGLSEKAGLAALTTNPAKILGVEKIAGTLETGKLANIVISDKPFFEKESKLKYVIVEGHMTKIKQKKKKEKKGGGSLEGTDAILGVWSYTVDVFGQEQTGKITITQNGSELSIELVDDSTPDDTDQGTDVSFSGGNLSFGVTVDGGGQDMPVEISLDFDEDNFSGTATIEGMGALNMEGSKISSPENK